MFETVKTERESKMAKRFTLPDSVVFYIKALPGQPFTIDFTAMDNESMLSGVMRGLKNILGDAVGGSDKSPEDKLAEATAKLAAFVAGTIGDGTRTLSPIESKLRELLSAWLVGKKWKKSAADKYARDGESVLSQWLALCEKNSIDPMAGQKVYDSWLSTAKIMIEAVEAAAGVSIPAPTPETPEAA
jgi:hypothetical protein